MQSLALCDYLSFEEAEEIILTTEGGEVPPGPENLVYRAAVALQRAAGVKSGALIHLDKRIPVAAGLGGGSADAAATLLGLNELWRLDLSRTELETIAAGVGADVPFCLAGGTALAQGKGEIITPLLPPAPAMGVVLALPSFGVSTAEVYARFDAAAVQARPSTAAMLRALRSGRVKQIAAALGNMLEEVTFALHPELAALKRAVMDCGALGALMSGSGPVIFGLTADVPAARRVAACLGALGVATLVTST